MDDKSATPVNPYAPPGAPFSAQWNNRRNGPAVPNTANNASASVSGQPIFSQPANQTPITPAGPAAPVFSQPSSQNSTTFGQNPVFSGPSTSQNSPFSQQSDIIIGAPQPEKSGPSKRVIVVIIMVALAIIVLLAVTIVLAQNANKSTKKVAYSQNSLNSYMNYTLYGSESDAAISGSYSGSTAYVIDKAINGSSEFDAAFFSKAKQKWDTFASSLDTSGSDILANLTDSHQKALNFFATYAQNTPLTDAQLIAAFQNGNRTEQYFTNLYNNYKGISEVSNRYYDSIVGYATAMIRRIQVYSNHSCIVDNELALTCLDDQDITDEESEALGSYIPYKSQQREIYSALASSVAIDAWSIYEVINSGGME